MTEEVFRHANVLINQIKIVKKMIKCLENNPAGLHIFKEGIYEGGTITNIEGDLREVILEYYRNK